MSKIITPFPPLPLTLQTPSWSFWALIQKIAFENSSPSGLQLLILRISRGRLSIVVGPPRIWSEGVQRAEHPIAPNVTLRNTPSPHKLSLLIIGRDQERSRLVWDMTGKVGRSWARGGKPKWSRRMRRWWPEEAVLGQTGQKGGYKGKECWRPHVWFEITSQMFGFRPLLIFTVTGKCTELMTIIYPSHTWAKDRIEAQETAPEKGWGKKNLSPQKP